MQRCMALKLELKTCQKRKFYPKKQTITMPAAYIDTGVKRHELKAEAYLL